MKNIPIEELEQILQETLNDAPKVAEILKKIAVVAEELKAEKEETKVPKAKNQFVIIGFEDGSGDESGIIVTIPEGEDNGTVLGRLSEAAREFNRTKKGQKLPISTIGECASLKRKFTKNTNIVVKTKIPVRIVWSNNQLI